jgi:hypothetical protein
MKRNIVFKVAVAALAIVPVAFGVDTSTMSVAVAPEASFTALDTTTTLTNATIFGAYTGTTNFTYKIRTTLVGGSGAITVSLGVFSGSGGPVIADLLYTCTAATLGVTACSSTTPTGGLGTPVATFGTDAHSADAGDAGTTAWTLPDKTTLKTGTFTSVATYTISAL